MYDLQTLGNGTAVYLSGNADLTQQTKDPIVIFIHGAGGSAHTWYLCIQQCLQLFPTETLFCAYDLYGHGKSSARKLSIDTLTEQLSDVLKYISCIASRKLILVGHSLGGAIAAKFTKDHKGNLVSGLILVDIAEEAALNNLDHMKSFLLQRPLSFCSIERALQWT